MLAQSNINDVYTDLSGLNGIKLAGRQNTAAGLQQVAKQFEAIFLNLMLKSMRDSTKVFGEGNMLNSNEMEFYQQNFDNQISLHLTQGRGIGLADMMYQQMLRQYEVETEAEPDRAVAGESKSQFSSPSEFIETLLPLARKAASKLGADPRVLLAQSALETGWGEKIIRDSRGANSHNLFGIKSDTAWQGPVAKTATLEFVDGIPQRKKASFRRYDSYAQSFNDYVQFLRTNPRYSQAIKKAQDPVQFANELQLAGFATDPDYGQKISNVLNSRTMHSALSGQSVGD